jgi:hypothetical protein
MFERNDFNVQSHNRDAVMLVDEISATEYYIGTSWNLADQSRPTWRIKKIWKDGSVWRFEFPRHTDPLVNTGNQDFVWVWNNRLSYTYVP